MERTKMDELFCSEEMTMSNHASSTVNHVLKNFKDLVPEPIIAEEEFAEMNYRIYDSVQYDYALSIDHWVPMQDDLGQMESIWGIVHRIDVANRMIKIINNEDYYWIEIERITRVRKIDYSPLNNG